MTPRSNDATRTFLIVVSVLMALVFGAITMLLYKLVTGSGGGVELAEVAPPLVAAAPEERPDAECEEGVDGQCPEGNLCIEGTCVPWEGEPAETLRCQPGDACDGCRCEAPLACTDGLCQAPTPPPGEQPHEACMKPEMQEALRFLVKACRARGGKDLTACTSDDWRSFAIESDRFDAIMATFPDQITLHFPSGKPPLRGGRWPGARDRKHYLAELERHRAIFDEAKLVFLIGRASPIGSIKKNRNLAFKRMNVAVDLLERLYDGPDRDEQLDALDRKLKTFGLGEEKPLTASFFARHYRNRYVTWSKQSTLRLRGAVQRPQSVSGRMRKWAINTINQVVFLIPVPCDGTELADPPPEGADHEKGSSAK